MNKMICMVDRRRNTNLILLLIVAAASILQPRFANGQEILTPRSGNTDQVVTLTLDEAIQIALVGNYALRSTKLDVENANAQVREAWSSVLPQVSASSSYTRNIKSANPFSGSEAGSLFMSFGFIDWLAYNEQARTDTDPSTEPISFGEFNDRRLEGMERAGIRLTTGDNPFAVPNQFMNGISVEQTLFNGSAFAAIAGAKTLKEINRLALDRQQQLLIDEVKRAFYQALLAQEQVEVSRQSVERTQQTLAEVSKQVTQGVAPKFVRLSAEVEVANLETQLVQLQDQSALALDNLKLILGVPVEQPLRLRGDLEVDAKALYQPVSADDAVQLALRNRPDLEQLRLAIDLRRIDRNISRSQFYPTVSAFANMNYIGNVPDNRTRVLTDPDDPFSFSQVENGFFSRSYWNPSVSAGFRVTWNIFNGFQTSAQVQQRQIAIEKAEVDYEQSLQAVRLEVERALRDLRTAQQRISSQEQNVDRAELNYTYAQARLREGVATPLEEREASEQLDLSRLNYLQAVYDYLVARSAFETAVGIPAADPRDFQLTSN